MVIALLIGVALIVTALFLKPNWLYLILAAVSFGFYFGNLSENWVLYLTFLLGMILIIVEFYIPDFGISGLIGGLVALIALYIYGPDIQAIILSVLYSLGVALLVGALFLKAGFSLSISPQFVLHTALNKERGYQVAKDLSPYLNCVGLTTTDLRPIGRAEFDHRVLEVISLDEMIVAGQTVKVEKVEGAKLYVRKVGGAQDGL